MAKFLITHQVEIEAEDEVGALSQYQESWNKGFYNANDCTIEETEGE